MAKGQKNEVVTTKKQESNLALTDEQRAMLEEDAAGSQELVTSGALARLTILQALSPQLNPRHEAFIAGAKAGDIVDIMSKETFEAPLPVLPCIVDERYLEWAPRESGGGLKGIYTTQQAKARLAQCTIDGPRRITPEGNSVDRTLQVHVLNLAALGSRCVIPFTRSSFKIGDGWLHRLQNEKVVKPEGGFIVPRPWYHVWFLNVAEKTNAKGSWLVFRPERGPVFAGIGSEPPFVPDFQDYRREAKEYEMAIIKGEIAADYTSMHESEAGEYEQGGKGGGADEGDAM